MIFHRQRGEDRTRIAVRAQLRIGTFCCEVTLLNAASRGVLAALDNPPVRGTKVRLVIGDMEVAGTVRWHGTDCCGIALAEPISVADLVEGRGVPAMPVHEHRDLRGLGRKFRALVAARG